jgi:hypothetical protein
MTDSVGVEKSGNAAAGERHWSVALTLAVSAVVAAVLGARAAIALGTAGDELQRSVRVDVKRGAGLVEDVRFVYDDEAPAAYRYAKARAFAEELQRSAATQSGIARSETLVEAGAQARIAAATLQASAIAKNPRYRRSDGSFDVGRRLADDRMKNPALLALSPDEEEAGGARTAWHGALDGATTLGPALAFFFAALAQAFTRQRRGLLVVAWLFIVAAIAAGITWELWLP